jgi:hypothetical protein
MHEFDYTVVGNRGWGWNDALTVFKKSENYQHGAGVLHGSLQEG